MRKKLLTQTPSAIKKGGKKIMQPAGIRNGAQFQKQGIRYNSDSPNDSNSNNQINTSRNNLD